MTFNKREYQRAYSEKHRHRRNPFIRAWQDEHKERVAQQNKGACKRRWQKYRKAIDEIKDRPCMDCGERYPPCAMDFDHVRGEKAGNISLMSSQSWSKIAAEIEKCELVCAICHRIRTQQRAKLNPTHGSRRGRRSEPEASPQLDLGI